MMKQIFLLSLLLFGFVNINCKLNAQNSREEYIEKYKDFAILEMKRVGIPASITMAQALLESNNGNSKLARRANNHFGIKCGGDWQGKTFHQDDDEKHECFRKYSKAEESFIDHSEFLLKPRYADLFKLKITDYKGWARGLKKAGYATNPKYPQLLIQIIEDNELYLLDVQDENTHAENRGKKKAKGGEEVSYAKPNKTAEKRADKDDFIIHPKQHEILTNNRIKYIVCKEGDSLGSLNKELDLMPWQLPKYNEIERSASLHEGQVLYLQPKRNKAEVGFEYHTVKEGESMYDISQIYGIKLLKLYQMNLLPEGEKVAPGTILNLRKQK